MPVAERRTRRREARPVAAPPAVDLRLHEFRSEVFGNTRTLRVWLPPWYEARGRTRYPVLYLNDGQNLFDPATAFAGVAWAVGETAARLIAEKKIRPLIVVGIDNTGEYRMREYIAYPSQDPPLPRPMGRRYPSFLVREVMPFIEGNYRVARGAEYTGLGGSSLGGFVTLYTQLATPGVFGRLLIESPSLFLANRKVLQQCRATFDWPGRVYIGVGSREIGDAMKDAATVGDVRELEKILRNSGMRRNLKVVIDEGAGHNEGAWAARFPKALEFLYS